MVSQRVPLHAAFPANALDPRGSSTDETEAAPTYDDKARDLFGQHAYRNFPEEIKAGDRRP